MTDLVLDFPCRLFFGPSALNRAQPFISSLGRRYLLVTEAVLHSQYQVRTVKECLEKHGGSVIVYDEVSSVSGDELLSETARLARTSRAEVVAGFGGMRTLSVAKCTASIVTLPYIEIPSTCRNPFMFTSICYKRFLENGDARDAGAPADAVIVDPGFFTTLPPRYSGTTIMSALLDAVESLLSDRKNFISESFAVSAVRELSGSLPFVLEDPLRYEHRERSAAGGVLSALAAGMTGPGPAAVLSFLLNRRYEIPKSWAGALLLPHILDVYAASRPERLSALAPYLGTGSGELTSRELAVRIVDEVRSLLGLIDLPFRLRNFELTTEQLMLIAEEAAAFPAFSRISLFSSADEVHRMLLQAY